jgi:hypothetical protein
MCVLPPSSFLPVSLSSFLLFFLSCPSSGFLLRQTAECVLSLSLVAHALTRGVYEFQCPSALVQLNGSVLTSGREEELSEAGEHTGENYITPCKLLRTSRHVGFIGTG